MREQGMWKRTLARWREKRRIKQQQAAEREYGGRAARSDRPGLRDLQQYRDPGASRGSF